jgi:predicted RNA binding protein YcfA (HicA-like mRNA interferase family)
MNPCRELQRLAERNGWIVRRTNGGHLRLTHPQATTPVFASSTPSDHRALANALAQMRRVLPREPKPAKPMRRNSQLTPRQVEQAVELFTAGGATTRAGAFREPGTDKTDTTSPWLKLPHDSRGCGGRQLVGPTPGGMTRRP